MAYFRQIPKLQQLLQLLSRDERWLILINADPDAMSAALALKRILTRRVKEVHIAKVNPITRPDNLALVRYTHMHMLQYAPSMRDRFQRFAIVDSQPHHHPAFADIPFSIIIDHHPLPETPYAAPYVEIKPDYGATATLMTEYLYALDMRPGKLLATALQFGIKTDTANFERHFCDVDMRAYHYLSRFADHALLSRIGRSEFHSRWLEFFAKACTNMYSLGSGQYVYIGEVENSDILVVIADFFMRVYEIRWVAVAGLSEGNLVVVFRSDGVSKDVGALASERFGDIGSAGGHKVMARAEVPAAALPEKGDIELFVWQRLSHGRPKARPKHGPVAVGHASLPDELMDDMPE